MPPTSSDDRASTTALPPLLTLLEQRPVVLDGAMGTMLYEQGHFINRAFDEANLARPDTVRGIHEANIEAGAEVITTNTFSANRVLLGRYGAADRTPEINAAGVRLAREASQGRAIVAGAVGPTGEGLGVMTRAQEEIVRETLGEQIGFLVAEGVDVLSFETFHHLRELQIAMQEAKARFDGPIMAQMSFGMDACLRDGTGPRQVADLLAAWGASIVGANCSEGPAIVHDVAIEMVPSGLPISAQPNAGQPRRLDQRSIYMATSEYLGVYAKRMLKGGVRLIGGCCGTKPEHVEAIAAAVRMQSGGAPRVAPTPALKTEVVPQIQGELPVPIAERSPLAKKVTRVWEERLGGGTRRMAPKGPQDFVVSVEVNPSPGLTVDKPLKAASMLLEAGVDAINIADGPRAAVRMSNTALALKMQGELGNQVILHVCCRDRNLLGLQADVLAAHVLGLHNLVVITGDPPKLGDYPKATAVFDLDSIELLKLIDSLNRGVDPAGKMVGEKTNFFLATGAEPAATDYERELDRLERKIEAGAELVMTQPVYDPEVVERFLEDTARFRVPVLLGICPLVSARNAEFLHNEVPGMSVPEPIRERMRAAGTGKPGAEEGVRIASEMVTAFADRVVGVYVMPQLGRYARAIDVLRPLGYGASEDA